MEYAIDVYNWHSKATQTIHKTTMVLVVIAMVVSVAQIIFGMVFYRRPDGHTKQQREMLELSTTRIKITTTVSGMILLLITLAFFYVYVRDVYEIKLPPQQFVE
jgi:heme/copper-type cytochrome/quinol oxidase subunit 2